MKNIVITGSTSRFGKILKKFFFGKNIFYTSKKELDILNPKKIDNYLRKKKAKLLVHIAGLSRPMISHEKDINKSINLNIIGTSNLVKSCKKLNIKIIYFSTNNVYPGKKGPYLESDPVLPINNYGWSKLGGECAVHMYENSLILRICMTESPFLHKKAFKNVVSNFMFHEDLAKKFKNLIHKKGIINIGGKRRTVFNFAKSYNKKIKGIKSKSIYLDNSMSIKKFEKIKNH